MNKHMEQLQIYKATKTNSQRLETAIDFNNILWHMSAYYSM